MNESSFPIEKKELESEITLIYEGDSFREGFEINALANNLSSLNALIEDILDFANKEGLTSNNAADIKEILLKPEKGSFVENITIFFSKPEVLDFVANALTALFFYLLGKKDGDKSELRTKKYLEESEERMSQKIVEKLAASTNTPDLKRVYDPIRKSKNNVLSIRSKAGTHILVRNDDVATLDERIRQLSEVNVETFEEEVVSGYISAINLDTRHLRFHPHGEGRSYPLTVQGEVDTLTRRMGKKESYLMRIRRVNGAVKSFELIGKSNKYKSLNEY